jgi:hypothetical protein
MCFNSNIGIEFIWITTIFWSSNHIWNEFELNQKEIGKGQYCTGPGLLCLSGQPSYDFGSPRIRPWP